MITKKLYLCTYFGVTRTLTIKIYPILNSYSENITFIVKK